MLELVPLRGRYWVCPFCKVIVPDYRRSWNSLETRICNHLEKFHGNENLSGLGLRAVLQEMFEKFQQSNPEGEMKEYVNK